MTALTEPALLRAHQFCAELAGTRNACFRVVSRVVPESLREELVPIFAFAQTVAMVAAVGNNAHTALDELEDHLRSCYFGETEHPLFVALTATIERRDLPMQPFSELISGYRDHLLRRRFATYSELRAYTDRAAGSVARLLLFFTGNSDSRVHRWADELAAGLAEVSFWQDIAIDAREDRIYIPADDLYHFGVSEDDVLIGRSTEGMRALVRFLVARTRGVFERASLLPAHVDGELSGELRRVWLEGLSDLFALETRRGKVVGPRARRQTGDPFGRLAPWANQGGAA